ncbi:hypothetical protein IT41_19645 [Paracoccus halophilus]|uniref:Uncharacterized protein n=1 Tax=Paracoccus halophilus TaxID=376733 RepID=A0A099ETQ0_9RHOB|nr:hypothetical protein IT41_19645 [Paracoccus halophilus]
MICGQRTQRAIRRLSGDLSEPGEKFIASILCIIAPRWGVGSRSVAIDIIFTADMRMRKSVQTCQMLDGLKITSPWSAVVSPPTSDDGYKGLLHRV